MTKAAATWLVVVLAIGLTACGGAGSGGGTDAATEAPRVEASEIDTVLADADVVFLDVREPDELEELGTIEGYVNIPIGELPDRLAELPKDKPILTA